MLKIAIKQMNSTVADFTGNTNMMIDAMQAAARKSTDLLVFPELSLCGYYPYDLIYEPFFIHQSDQALSHLLEASNQFPELTSIIGTVRRNKGSGNPFYNALVVISNGKVIAEYYKQLLPTYNVFDERRHFEPGPAVPCLITVNNIKIGLLICEDSWNDSERKYTVNPFRALVVQKPELLIIINASPSNIGKREQRHNILSNVARHYQLPLLSVNSVGGQDSLVFDGASFAINDKGVVIYEAAQFTATQEYICFDAQGFKNYSSSPCTSSNNELAFKQIILGLRDYSRRCGFNKVVIGLSGGIDSALTLTLAVDALSADNVIGITMPSVFSSKGSVSDSKKLCENLGVKLINHPIKQLVEQYSIDFSKAFNKTLQGLTLENLQARIRGTILMEYSNEFDALLLSTGNKSEISIGYCTLYGDTNGGLNLLGDLYKTEVYSLSEYINNRAGYDVIPMNIINKEPSAELAVNQKDTDTLPPYEVLDEILKYLIEGKQLSEIEYAHVKNYITQLDETDPALVNKVRKMIAHNEYKRFQAPPIIRLRARAFGNGRQMPITAKY
ncbi:NAD+ synthetase [Methyloprofundus sedimenti]|uniref:Glutamine-dependent NAD(+) synthetase n=1 Tax=Methyloprofundus sedimenti TaxID=1420851 RepID=A0A1V8M0L9_9GAMM|nr:NAD+ synthase [Methyloprofundus sedimenti]OQK15107.1 NAD+ synthetase [Methyloprofundus sedimenti]